MCSAEDMKKVVQEEFSRVNGIARERARKDKFVLAGLLSGVLITAALSMVQDHFVLDAHVGDGHPETVEKTVAELKIITVRMEARQEAILEDVVEIKKKLELRNP